MFSVNYAVIIVFVSVSLSTRRKFACRLPQKAYGMSLYIFCSSVYTRVHLFLVNGSPNRSAWYADTWFWRLSCLVRTGNRVCDLSHSSVASCK
ncbi:hypothetical protein V8C35DRAFT_292003 [Trichoderma chlorosporum]